MMNFINKYIGIDGLVHIIVCIIMMQMLSLMLPMLWSAIITAIIGIGKEAIYNYYLKKGTASLKDIICDFVGILIALV